MLNRKLLENEDGAVIKWYENPQWYRWMAFGSALLGVVVFIVLIFAMFVSGYTISMCNMSTTISSQYGDFVGGVIGTIFTFAAFAVVYASLLVQQREIADMKKQAMISVYETKLYKLLELSIYIGERLTYFVISNEGKESQIHGKEIFDLMFDKCEELRQLFNLRAKGTLNSKEEASASELYTKLKIPYLDSKNAEFNDHAGVLMSDREVYLYAYSIVYDYWHAKINHYYMQLLYNTNYIVELRAKNIISEQIYDTAKNILFTPMTHNEKKVLLLHSLYFKEILGKYELYDSLEKIDIVSSLSEVFGKLCAMKKHDDQELDVLSYSLQWVNTQHPRYS